MARAKASQKTSRRGKQSARVAAPTEAARAEGARMLWALLIHPASQQVYAGLALLLAFCMLYNYSLGALADDPRYRVELTSLRLEQVPEWIPRGQGVTIRLPARYRHGISIFDPALVDVVARAYERSAWVARVRHVQKVYPNRLKIAVDLRKPVALVAVRPSGFVLVDAASVRLPGHYPEPPDLGLRLPVIDGAMSTPPPPGQIWRDLGVADGARLATLWADKGLLSAVGLQRIDVRNVGGRVDRRRSEVVMYLASETPLRWGRVSRPGRTDPLGVPDEQKVAILRHELIDSGRLREDPQLSYVRWMDIQHGQLRIGRR